MGCRGNLPTLNGGADVRKREIAYCVGWAPTRRPWEMTERFTLHLGPLKLRGGLWFTGSANASSKQVYCDAIRVVKYRRPLTLALWDS